MSDPVGPCRSNYFRVKDKVAFVEWICDFDVELVWRGDQAAFLANAYDGGIPDRDADEDGLERIGLEEEIHEYLAPGEVCVILYSGAERLRVLWGGAVAIHSSGESVALSLSDIYERAQQAFKMSEKPSAAEY